MAIQKNSSKEQPKSTTGEKNSQERAQKKNLSKLKASTYLTSKKSASSLNEHLIKHQSNILHPDNPWKSIIKAKDPILKEDRNNAVYQLNCKDCEAVCVGETKRTLNIRVEEHITAIKSASKRNHTAEHCSEHKKVVDFDQWNILQITKYVETNTTRKQSKENKPQNCNIIKLSPQRSTNKYGSTQVRNQSQPIRNNLKIF